MKLKVLRNNGGVYEAQSVSISLVKNGANGTSVQRLIPQVIAGRPPEPQPEPTSAAYFSFSGDMLTGYNGGLSEIVIPKTYSLGSPTTITTPGVLFETADYGTIVNWLYSFMELEFQDATNTGNTHTYTSNYELMNLSTDLPNGAYLNRAVFETNYEASSLSMIFNELNKFPITCNGKTYNDSASFDGDIYSGETTTFSFGGSQTIYPVIDGADYQVKSIGENAFKDSSVEKVVALNNITSIGAYAFKSCKELTQIVLPTSLTTIGHAAFEDCSALTTIEVPDSVTEIDIGAFEYCSSLQSVTLPKSLTVINDSLFNHCYALKSITIPNTVTTIQAMAFNQCRALTKVEIPGSVSLINNNAFNRCDSLTELVLNEGVTKINKSAFSNAPITSLYIPSTVSSIGEASFACPNLTSIRVSANNPIYADEGANAVIETATRTVVVGCTTTIIPNDVVRVGDWAFYHSNLASIVIPNSVTSFGKYAFRDCSANITFGTGLTTIEDGAFCESGLKTLNLPEGVTTIGTTLCSSSPTLESVTIPTSVTTMGQECFSGCTGLKTVTLSNKLTAIAHRMFNNCTSLESIIIPDSVTTINLHAFYGCTNLTTIVFGAGLTTIGEYAFYNCAKIQSLEFKDNLTTINTNAFYNCSGIKSVVFGAGITTIGSNAFYGCTGITGTVDLPSSITTMQSSAFGNCTGITRLNIRFTSNTYKVTTWGTSWIRGCSASLELYIPSSVSNPANAYGSRWNYYSNNGTCTWHNTL